MAKAEYAKKREEADATREANLAQAAIDFMGLKEADVASLRAAYDDMDHNGNGSVEITEFFKFMQLERTSLADSIFFFMDGSFVETLTFGAFLRTVCTFCMFGAKEMVTWVFSVVAANLVGKAEAMTGVPKPGRAGARGVDRRRNRSVYWEQAVAWSGLKTSDTQGKISTAAFNQLMYSIHPPTSAMALTAKRAIARAAKMSVANDLRLFQFRQVVADYPMLLSPIFLLQTSMRQRFLGERWWATKRQLFSDAREVVKEQFALETRMKLLAREEDRARKAEEKKKARDEYEARKAAGGRGRKAASDAAALTGMLAGDDMKGGGGAAGGGGEG